MQEKPSELEGTAKPSSEHLILGQKKKLVNLDLKKKAASSE